MRFGVVSSVICLRLGFITFKTLTNVAKRPLNTFSGSSASFSTDESKNELNTNLVERPISSYKLSYQNRMI
jgi:hypothetical protein